VALSAPTAWLFGNEAWGLPPDLLALADQSVAVPIYGRAESLNLAAAAAVCLYASAAALRNSHHQRDGALNLKDPLVKSLFAVPAERAGNTP
jgi:TrmH family RNA methyltransferase